MTGPAIGAEPVMPLGIHPDRLLACFTTVSSPVVLEHLRDEPRFADRLAAIVAGHYGLSTIEGPIDSADQALVAFSTEELDAIALRAGVVINARAFLREIRGPMLAALGERFGPLALDDARRFGEMAAERPPAGDVDELEQVVRRDGQACLAAWIAALPEPIARHVKLKWPDDASLPIARDAGTGAADQGAQVLRRLVVDRKDTA